MNDRKMRKIFESCCLIFLSLMFLSWDSEVVQRVD